MTLRDHLLAIHAKYGQLTPELVVAEARPVEHPLHGHVFDREPGDAAEAWYRHRAHELIQSVRVTYRAPTASEPTSIRAFQAVRGNDAQSYVYEPVEAVASNEVLSQMVLRDMEREWKQLRARYGHFKEFVKLVRSDMAA